jgi:hypothetical protein
MQLLHGTAITQGEFSSYAVLNRYLTLTVALQLQASTLYRDCERFPRSGQDTRT